MEEYTTEAIMEPDYLTPQQVAKITGIGNNNVYKLLQKGCIPVLRMDTRYYIPKTAFLAFWHNPEAIMELNKILQACGDE